MTMGPTKFDSSNSSPHSENEADSPDQDRSERDLTASDLVASISYFGPIPPPHVVRGWEEACPGASNRILSMAELEAEHRREMKKAALSTGQSEDAVSILVF